MKPLPSYSHCTNHLYAITIVVAVIFVVVSCQHHTPSSLYRVEKRIATHPDSFSNYISAISEAQIDSAQQGNLHTPHCLLTLCCCKAASALQSGKDDSVRYWFVKAGNIVYKYSFSSQPVSMLQRIDTVQMRSCMNEISRAKEMLAQASAYSDVAHYTGNPAFENKSDSLKRVVVKNLYSLYKVLPHYPCNVMYGKSIPHRYVFMGILGCLLLALLLWEHKKKRKALDDCRLAAHQECIDQLNATIRLKENENKKLQKRIQNDQQEKALSIGYGNIIYESVRTGGTMKNISIEEERCFVDYFAFAFPSVYQELTVPYSSLSLRHTTYLILCNMGFSDIDIGRILFVQPSTLRNYRLRIKQKKKSAVTK